MTTPALPTSGFSALEALPHIVLDIVCDYLVAEERERSNLFAFSLTSKLCCQVTTRLRFERIHISARDPRQLEHIVSEYDTILGVGGRQRHVRKANITGYMNVGGEKIELIRYVRAYSISPPRWHDPRFGWDGKDLISRLDGETYGESSEMVFSRPPSLFRFAGWEPIITPETKAKRNELWKPLVTFLAGLHGLKHILWASADQIPRCLLDLLHNQFPHSNLHVNTFSLRSLYQNESTLHDIDEDEYALVTSPCLSSISAASFDMDDKRLLDFTEAAILQMVMGMAPNLQTVCMWYQHTNHMRGPFEASQNPRPLWPGFVTGDNKSDKIGTSTSQVTNLTMRGQSRTHLKQLQNWSCHMDFAMLRSLSFQNNVDTVVLQALIDMARMQIFKSLKSFSLYIGSYSYHVQYTDPGQQVLTATLLFTLEPLEALEIDGQVDKAMMISILGQHGTSLHRLHLPKATLPHKEIIALSEKCSNVRSLQIAICRNGGSKEEVQLYRSLGSMPRLSDLTIGIQSKNDNIYINRNLRAKGYEGKLAALVDSALIDNALDADLAHSIFHTILSTNMQSRPRGIIPTFQTLRTHTDFATADLFNSSIDILVNWICRSWLCQRKLSDAESTDVIVLEIGRDKRPNPGAGFVMTDFQRYDVCPDLDLYRSAWNTIWPDSKELEDGWNVWHSLPLWSES